MTNPTNTSTSSTQFTFFNLFPLPSLVCGRYFFCHFQNFPILNHADFTIQPICDMLCRLLPDQKPFHIRFYIVPQNSSAVHKNHRFYFEFFLQEVTVSTCFSPPVPYLPGIGGILKCRILHAARWARPENIPRREALWARLRTVRWRSPTRMPRRPWSPGNHIPACPRVPVSHGCPQGLQPEFPGRRQWPLQGSRT